MKLTRLEAAIVLGIVIPQISSISISSAPSDCLAAVDTCMSDLCESEQAFYGCISNSKNDTFPIYWANSCCTELERRYPYVLYGHCKNEGCQIKGSEVCNMTIQTILDQFPSLRGCVCAWEEELCDSIQALATQCHRKPARQLKRSTVTDWKSSSLIGYVYDGAGSCFDQMRVCVSDVVCNRHLAPVLQACMTDPCDSDRCQQETQHFYGSMPQNVAEMLAMCECEASDQYCLQMKTALHSGTCEDKTWICQVSVNQCADDSNCRDLLKTFQAKCWSPEEAQCSNSDLHSDECFTKMDPAFVLGAESECKMAFLATLGTALHHPCSCEGLHSEDLHTCNLIHDVLHNRSHFMTSSKISSGPSKPPKISDSEHGHTWSHDYLLYVFATVLFVGVAILMPLAVVTKIWMTRTRDRTKYHNPQKSNCVVIL